MCQSTGPDAWRLKALPPSKAILPAEHDCVSGYAAPADHQGQVRAGGPAEGAGAQVCARLAWQPRRAVLLPAHPRQGGRRQRRIHARGE